MSILRNKVFIVVLGLLSVIIFGFYIYEKRGDKNDKNDVNVLAKIKSENDKGVNAVAKLNKDQQSSSLPETIAPKDSPVRSDGDKGQVFEKFYSDKQCHSSWHEVTLMQDKVNACLSHSGNKLYYERCSKETAGYQKKIQSGLAELNTCSNDQNVIERNFYNSTKFAAEMGNIDAQLCYMQGNFSLDARQHEKEVDSYKADAPRYLEWALNRGDWRAVALMATDGHYLNQTSGFIEYLIPGDVAMTYRMTRLLRLGATGNFANFLDSSIKDYSGQLSTEELVESDAWAKQIYGRYFANSPVLTERPAVCPD